MKKLFYIQLFAAVASIGIFSTSCMKDEAGANCGQTTIPDYNVLELYFDTPSTTRATTSQQQGDQISDVTVWAYEITKNTDGTITAENEGKPVGWATKTYSGTYESTTEGFRMELPYSESDKTYRLFAVANSEQFGTIYSPMQDDQQTEVASLSNTLTYDVLSSYVFEAGDVLMGNNVEISETESETNMVPALMPVSHWKDLTIAGGTTTQQSVNMTLYRALAKVSLYAKIDNASSDNTNVEIIEVTISAKEGRHIHLQSALFSGAERVENANQPEPYAHENVVKNGDYTPTSIALTNATFKKGDTEKYIGAKFLYENHNGATQTPVAAADTDNFGPGSYYMTVNYKYWAGNDESSAKTAVGYVELPATIRNHEIRINANFTVKVDGSVTLQCNVADWTEGTNTELDFNYPTYSVMAYDRDTSNNPVYDSSISGTEAFTLLFQMSSPTDGSIKWHPVLMQAGETNKTESFNITVHEVSGDPTDYTKMPSIENANIKHSDGIEGSSTWYAIEVAPKNNVNTAAEVNLCIVYNAPWLNGAYESMLINGTAGNPNWDTDDDDGHYIKITYTPQTSN